MAYDYQTYLSNAGYKADNEGRRAFGHELMLAFKQKNISEGIQWYQAIHMHARFRAWQVNLPAPLSTTETVDLLNMILSGDIETACLAAQFGVPDAMTAPTDWVSQSRIDWAVEQMKVWLGWA